MDEFLKDNFKNCINFLKNKMNANENYQLVEKKRKIYYFSKFSLDVDEFFLIYQTIKKVKENVFRNMLDCLKFCAKEIVTFASDKTEKDKILILFTICFLHFYTNFSYENNFKFEDYYTQELVNLCTKYKVLIVDIKQFKIFCYSFYEQIIKEINKIDYNRLKLLYSFYNPDSLNNENLLIENNHSKNILEICKYFFKKLNPNLTGTCFNYFKIQNLVNNKFFKPLISTTERVVDMVLSIDSKEPKTQSINHGLELNLDNKSKHNNIKVPKNQINAESNLISTNLYNNQTGNINNLENSLMNNKYNRNPIMHSNDNLIHVEEKNIKNNDNDSNNTEKLLINIRENPNDNLCIDTESNNSCSNTSTIGEQNINLNNKSFVGKSNNTLNIKNFNEKESMIESFISAPVNSKPTFSKRILCELIKSDVNEKEEEIICDIGQKLNDLIEMILNKSENKIYFVQMFICYIVEINSELIKLLPEFQNLNDDVYIRYIISAKNIYNYAIEVYFSINDMYNIDMDAFMDVFAKKFPFNNDENLARNILSFFKTITAEFSKNKGLSIYDNFQNLFTTITNSWDKEIIEKGQELTRFYAI